MDVLEDDKDEEDKLNLNKIKGGIKNIGKVLSHQKFMDLKT